MKSEANEFGFSLLEMLFVLMIVMLLAFIVVPVMNNTYIETEIDRFFDVFDSDIRFIQNQALKGRELSINLDEDYYFILENKQKLLETRNYPEAFLPKRFISERIEFWNTGTVKEPSSFFFRNEDGRRYKVVFPFGKGRHYIEEF